MVRSDDDPFTALGLDHTADADEVRAARRRLARAAHPDAGGDTAHMASLNDAAARALRQIAARDTPFVPAPSPNARGPFRPGRGTQHDVPSFTVEALPVEAFEALVVVAGWFGEIIDDDPPYRLDVHTTEPFECWCRLDIVPDAGASTVSLAVGGWADEPPPPVEEVRDVFVDALNRLDWDSMHDR